MPRAVTGITTLYHYLNYINDTEDDPNSDISFTDQLRFIIDQSNSLISQKCNRVFGSATYQEWVEGGGENYLILRNYPITRVFHCASNSVDLMTVEGTGFQTATITSNSSALILTSQNTAGSTTETDLLYVDNANVSSMVTAIDLISGWDAEVLSGEDDALTSLIRPLDSGWALDEKVYLAGPYQGISVRVSDDSDSIIERLDGCSFNRFTFIRYIGGYTLPVCDDVGGTLTTAGNVPEALTLIANKIVKDTLQIIDEDVNMSSEKLGDYGYTRSKVVDAVDRHWSSLSAYARKIV